MGGTWSREAAKGGDGTWRVGKTKASKKFLRGGLYDIQGKEGIYYEILINRMDGIIAVGMCSYLWHLNAVPN